MESERKGRNSGVEPSHRQGNESTTEIRVLLFVDDDTARRQYLNVLADCGVRVFVSTSFFHLSEEISSQTFHGLLLDLPTKMKAIRENKGEVYRLAEKFPVAHLRIDSNTHEIRCFHVGRKAGDALVDFIDNQCRNAAPQKLRTSIRREIHLPVKFSRFPESRRRERSITQDISPWGCFIITTRRWRAGDEIFLDFPGLSDSTPIRGEVRTVVKWGTQHQIPGIGVKLKELSSSQATELTRLWQQTDR
jgi:hypothetical protein